MADFGKCHACGMTLLKPGEFHPHAACVLYKHTGQAEKVESALRQAIEWGMRLERLGLPADATVGDVTQAEMRAGSALSGSAPLNADGSTHGEAGSIQGLAAEALERQAAVEMGCEDYYDATGDLPGDH